MCKVRQAGFFTRRFFNNEGVKGNGIEKNITRTNKTSSFSRLGKILKRVVNINIFLRGHKSDKEKSAAQVISVNRISVNEASCLRESLKGVNVKTFNGNEKSPAFTPCAEDFFRSSKKAPGKLPPPPPPLSNNKNDIAMDRMQSDNTATITQPFAPPPASPSMQPASPSAPPVPPPVSSSTQPPTASPLTQPAWSSAQSVPPSVQPVPPSAQFAPPPPPLPAQDFLKPNNALRKNPLNGTGKNRGVMQKEPGSNEQGTKPGAFFNNLDVNKLTPFQKKIYQQMQENAAIKAKSDKELAEKKAEDKAKEAQQEAQKKIDELKNRQAFIEKCKDGIPPPPPPPPLANAQPFRAKMATESGNKEKPIQPKRVNVLKNQKSDAVIDELKELLSRRTQQP